MKPVSVPTTALPWSLLLVAVICSSTPRVTEAQEPQTGTPPETISIRLGTDETPQKIALSEFSWLTGSWKGTGLGGDCVEVWSDPVGDTIVGSFVFAKDGKTVFTEHFALTPLGESVTLKLKHFDDKFSAWEEREKFVEFRFAKRDGNRFHFNGLTYVNVDKNRMDVYLLMRSKDGKTREEKFEFQRTR
jgi:hypothetical protein